MENQRWDACHCKFKEKVCKHKRNAEEKLRNHKRGVCNKDTVSIPRQNCSCLTHTAYRLRSTFFE